MKPSTATKDKRKQGPPHKPKLPGNRGAKKVAKPANANPKERGINARQERFAQFVASGIPDTTAYIQAGYKNSEKNGERNAWQLKENQGVKARIAELLAKNAEKSEYKRADLVKLLVSVLKTPVDEVDETHVLAQEVTTDAIRGGIVRTKVKMMGKIESARLLVEIMGWKEPEKHEVDVGPRMLDAIKERAERVASALDLQAHLRAKAAGTTAHANGNGHSNGNGHAPTKAGSLSRW